ncbi:MAG: hypothetical protein K8R02_07070 [Anaerohalosphaeraceae bacterium]|nr:hypothetical protein [Anaerohalosphaeraceae bacterium]
MAEWQIDKPLGVCAGTDLIIEPDCEYFAALVEAEEGLTRRDYSCDYWQQNRPEVFCYWKSKMPKQEQKKNLFVDNDMLLAFFDRLENETDQDKLNFRFVLMLILMRKRILKYDSSKSLDGKEVWVLKVVHRDHRAEVVNPQLTEEQVAQLSSQLGQILQVEFNE